VFSILTCKYSVFLDFLVVLVLLLAKCTLFPDVSPSPIIVFQIPTKIDPQLLWNVVWKLESLITSMLPHSDPTTDAAPWDRATLFLSWLLVDTVGRMFNRQANAYSCS